MLCQACKEREATIHYTKIVDGEVEELHLCDDCTMGNNEFEFDSAFSFHKLLTGLIDSIQEGPKIEEKNDLRCSFCGLSYSEFKQTGKFGCMNCYNTFENKLDPLFRGIHGHSEHVGKIPIRGNEHILKQKKIDELKKQLQQLIVEEAFEEAAILRDKIKELENNLVG